MRDLLAWLIRSSADPEKTSATAKGVLKVIAAYVLQLAPTICGLGLYCLGVGSVELNQAIDFIGTLVIGILYVFGALQSLYGLYRKTRFGRWAAPTN